MAYSSTGLQPIGGQAKAGNAPQVWSYTSTDAKTAIDAAGYFNDASDLLKVGDLIISTPQQVVQLLLAYTQ